MERFPKKIVGVFGFVFIAVLSCFIHSGSQKAFAAETSAFVKGEYNAVVYGYVYEESQLGNALLVGGSKDGKWYDHIALPVTSGGKILTQQNAPAEDYSEPIPCATPFLKQGETVVFYSPSGKKTKPVPAGKTTYSQSPASGETFIDVEFGKGALPSNEFLIGVNGEWEAVLAPTKRSAKQGVVSFSSDLSKNGSKSAATVTFTAEKDENDYPVYRGKVKVGETEWPLTEAYAENDDEISGMFIDLNGDGEAEFVLYASGVGGFLGVYEIGEREPQQIMALDFGD